MLRFCALLASACCLFVAVSGSALAGQAATEKSGMQALLEMMVSKGMITDSEAEGLLRISEKGASTAESPPIRKESSSEWADRLKWSGDMRLRYQGDYYDDGNTILIEPGTGDEVVNTTRDRHRLRYRARLGLSATVNERWRAAFRLATGNDNDPVSTNDTLGDNYNKDSILFDQAYLEWKPTALFTLTGGRIPNPWFSTDLVWDRDLNFEGLAVNYRQALAPWLSLFATAGAFPLEEVEWSSQDKWLYGAQIGARVGSAKSVSAQLGAAYYYYDNIAGERYDPTDADIDKDYTAPGFLQKGNTLMDINEGEAYEAGLAAEFEELDILATVDVGFWDPVHMVFLGEYVTNLGFDRDEVSRRYGEEVPDVDTAYMFGMALGHPAVNDLGKWNVFLFYKHLEADAVLDAFTDSDFRLGGTNAKGWVLGTEFGLAHNVWLTGKWQSADEIDGPPHAVDVLQVDLNAKF